MRTKAIVSLIADAGEYVPTMYEVVECTIGSTAATSYLWLEVIGYGITTVGELNVLKTAKQAGTVPNFSVLHGTKGAFSIATLAAVTKYDAVDSLVYGTKNIGQLGF